MSERPLSEPLAGPERTVLQSRASAQIGRPSARRRRTRRLASPPSVRHVREQAGRGLPGPRQAVSSAPRAQARDQAGSCPAAPDENRHVAHCTGSRTAGRHRRRRAARAPSRRAAAAQRPRDGLPAPFSLGASPPAPSRERPPARARACRARSATLPASRPGSGRCPSGWAPPRPPPAAPRRAPPRAAPS
jgi:hypothetical protein